MTRLNTCEAPDALTFRRFLMKQQFEAVQTFGKDSFEATVKALDVASTGTKAIVVETADYAKNSFDQNAATLEKLAGVKSLDQAIQNARQQAGRSHAPVASSSPPM